MRKMAVSPEHTSYSATDSSAASYAILDGPAGRIGTTYDRQLKQVNVAWIADDDEFHYLRAFFRTGTAFASLPFLIDLILDGALATYTAHFAPGTMLLASVAGESFRVQAVLEVAD